jgi:hypothetical protein
MPQHAADILREQERSNSANVIFRTALGKHDPLLRQTRAKWHLVDPIFAANVSPMKCVNQTRTNVVNRLRIHQDLRAFFAPEARS